MRVFHPQRSMGVLIGFQPGIYIIEAGSTDIRADLQLH